TTVKDYGHMFELDEGLSEKAKTIGNLAKDITEFLADLDLKTENFTSDLRIAYHSACSLQHGQKITDIPKDLLANAGFDVYSLPEAHICCGSAGTYNLLQPELSSRLKERKVNNIKSLAPDLVSAGNIGCIEQIASGMDLPVVHTVQLLDWASGGPKPEAIS
ncbi:MAG: heterodisulfide reductase-related iron-sulfur binding cluster, partial [Sneathiella sp.]